MTGLRPRWMCGRLAGAADLQRQDTAFVALARSGLGNVVSLRELEVGDELGEKAGKLGVGLARVVGIALLGIGVE